MRIPALLVAASLLMAVDYAFPNQVELRRQGECIRIVNARDNQELLVVAANVVAVVPATRDDNNAWTCILLGAHSIRLQQRENPADAVVAALAALGFDYVPAVSDRDNREPDHFLVNMRRVDLVERTRTDSDRSDTVLYFSGGGPAGLTRVAINQSAAAYAEFRERAARQAR